MRGDAIPFLPTRQEVLPAVHVLAGLEDAKCYRIVEAMGPDDAADLAHGTRTAWVWEGVYLKDLSDIQAILLRQAEGAVVMVDPDRILAVVEVSCD